VMKNREEKMQPYKTPSIGPDEEYSRKKDKQLMDLRRDGREIGRQEGFNRQQRSAGLGGVIGTPAAYIERAGQFIGDKFDDVDAFLSEKTGMRERAAFKKGMREGLKDEGYKKGGVVKKASTVSSASKRADGIAMKGKTRGRMV
jgi:hypothetical protein